MIVKRLYKDVDISQKFIQIDNCMEFDRIDNDKSQQANVPKQPEQIPTSAKELTKKTNQQQQQQNTQQIYQQKLTKSASYYRIMCNQILPYQEIYELKDNDLIFIKDFNEKYKLNITQEYLEQLIMKFELKSGKNFVVSWIDIKDSFTQEEISKYSFTILEKIYIYWKQARDIYGFPLLRINQRPSYNDKDPRVAFRPRVPEKMKLRKNQKQNDEESYLRLVSLKEEMSRYQLLTKQLVLREKLKQQQANQLCINFISEIYKLEKNYQFMFDERELNSGQDFDNKKNEIEENFAQTMKQKQETDKEYYQNVGKFHKIQLNSLRKDFHIRPTKHKVIPKDDSQIIKYNKIEIEQQMDQKQFQQDQFQSEMSLKSQNKKIKKQLKEGRIKSSKKDKDSLQTKIQLHKQLPEIQSQQPLPLSRGERTLDKNLQQNVEIGIFIANFVIETTKKAELSLEKVLNLDTKTLTSLSSLKHILNKKNSELANILQTTKAQSSMNQIPKINNMSGNYQHSYNKIGALNNNIQSTNQVTNAVLYQIRARIGRQNLEYVDRYFEENPRYQDLANIEVNYKFNGGEDWAKANDGKEENQQKNQQENKLYTYSQLDKNKFNKQYFLNIKRKYQKYIDYDNFIENENEENKNLKKNISNAIKDYERKKTCA